MDAETDRNPELAARLKRLDADDVAQPPGFGYDAMLERHAARQARARRRARFASGTASALVLAFVGLGVWRFHDAGAARVAVDEAPPAAESGHTVQPRIVRADTYFAIATLEDHIASIDDALTVARVVAPRGAEVARLEKTRAELLDS